MTLKELPDIYGWLGVDELGSGLIGFKQHLMPAGIVPLVTTAQDAHKITSAEVLLGLGVQSMIYGKEIVLVRFVPVEIVRIAGK